MPSAEIREFHTHCSVKAKNLKSQTNVITKNRSSHTKGSLTALG
jgi:hypothetical protein